MEYHSEKTVVCFFPFRDMKAGELRYYLSLPRANTLYKGEFDSFRETKFLSFFSDTSGDISRKILSSDLDFLLCRDYRIRHTLT